MRIAVGKHGELSNRKERIYILYIFLMTYLVFRPYYFTRIPALSALTTYATILFGAYYMLYSLNSVFHKKRASVFILLIFVYYLWYYFSAVLNGHSFTSQNITNLITGINRLLILVYSMHTAHLSHRIRHYYTGVAFALFSMLIINIVSIITNPAGLLQIYVYGNNTPTAMYFLGNDNSFWTYLTASATAALMYYATVKKHTKIVFLFCILLSTITPLITRSLTSSIGIITMVTVMGIDMFKHDIIKGRLFSARTFFIIIIVLNCLLLLFDPIKLFAEHIYALFGRNASFISRVDIWNSVKHEFWEHPIIGHGLAQESNYVLFYTTGHSVSAHNNVLQILYFGGVVGLGLCLLILVRAYRGITKEGYVAYGFFACLGLFAYGIAALAEVPSNDLTLIFLMCILYYSKYIDISDSRDDGGRLVRSKI